MPFMLFELGAVILHTLIIYLFLILILSLTGFRQAAEISAVELVVIMVLGSAVETSLINGDTSLLAGLVSAATLLMADRVLDRFEERFPRIRRIIAGRAILLVHNGHPLPQHLRAAGLSDDDLLEGIRERGYDNLDQVKFAVLERDGTISVVPRDTSPTAQPT